MFMSVAIEGGGGQKREATSTLTIAGGGVEQQWLDKFAHRLSTILYT